jgi:hypothetical protein
MTRKGILHEQTITHTKRSPYEIRQANTNYFEEQLQQPTLEQLTSASAN